MPGRLLGCIMKLGAFWVLHLWIISVRMIFGYAIKLIGRFADMDRRVFRRNGWLGVVLSLVLCLVLVSSLAVGLVPGSASADDLPNNLVQELQELTEGRSRVSTHAKTGKVRFIGTELSHPIPQPAALKASASPEEAARGFLAEYGRLFGLSNQAEELEVMRSKTLDDGRSFVRFQQVYDDVPILGGELIVQVNSENDIISANGEVLPDISLDTSPTVGASSAEENALNAIAREYDLESSAFRAGEPELWIYNPIVLGTDWDMTSLVWRIEVEPVEMLPIRELVLVDARLGVVALHFNQVATAKYRLIYDNNNDRNAGLPGSGPVRSEGDGPYGVADVNDAYDYAGDTYDFYYTNHSRDSLDDAGMNLISTVRYCDPDTSYSCPFANAFWNGSQMVYGQGYASADDVVGHEMTHGVTSYESGLFYYMQSGAINEGFSDIWGEFIDLTNGAGTDTAGVRWLIGEDLSGGAGRDMSDPPYFSDPDRMSSTYYVCGTSDQGGVHTNSGVANKAAYLMVDGDYFNGYTVAGFGGDIAKAADLWYEVQSNMFTSGSDYDDLYDCLQQAAINLGFSTADRQTVEDAVDATEMNLQPTSCPATDAPICDSGSATNLWFDNLENTASGYWTPQPEWYYPQNSHSYPGWDATYATSGQYNIWGYDRIGDGTSGADYYIAMTTDVALPPGSTPYLYFSHAYWFDHTGVNMWDGGVVEYSTNGGSSWNDAGSLFTHNGYDGTISTLTTNPLSGRQAFGGLSNGYISSRLDLSSLAGQSVRFRFGIGIDFWDETGTDAYGWWIDDIRIYTCGAGAVIAPTVTTNAASSVEETTAILSGTIIDDGGEACEYQFQYGTSPGVYDHNTGWTGSKTTGQPFSAPISSLNKGTKYYFRAQANNSAGTVSGLELSFLTKPDAPTSFDATSAGTTQMDLSWTKGDGAQKTKIQRKEGDYPTNKDDGTEVYFDTGTSTPDTGLTPGTTYYYRAWSYVSGSEQWSDNYAEESATTTGAGGQPDISVSPPSFEKTLPPDTSHNYPLTIGNVGEATLSYNISDRETAGPGSAPGIEEQSLPAGEVEQGEADAQAGEMPELAPMNPDFAEFWENPPEPFYGYIPPPMDLSHLEEIPVERVMGFGILPSSFDWRTTGKVTSVKDQNPCGTCWVHGTLAAVESKVLIEESPVPDPDYSEQNLDCCTDPAWVYLIGNRCLGGGWSWLAADTLTKKGTRLESCQPYDTGIINAEACDDECESIKMVTDYRMIANQATSPEVIVPIKNAVYNHGPVAMSYRADDGTHMYAGSIYYWPGCTENANHLVCIVGWDDTIEHPAGGGSGAWIVKNSWGTGWVDGDNGYFYLCYGSASMCEVASFDYKDYDPDETLYYWDEAGQVDAAGCNASSAWMANIFTSNQDGSLTHVDFWTTSNNAEYEIYVYLDGDISDDLQNQVAYQSGTCQEFGYYSIPLSSPVSLTNGQSFTIAVKMTTPAFVFPIPVEYEIPGLVDPPIEIGVSYARCGDTGAWDDVGLFFVGWNVCLRARVSAAAGADCTWLSESPTLGSVAPTGSDEITVSINTTGLAAGDYSAEIVISNNDPDGNPKTVPVTLHVGLIEGDVSQNGCVSIGDAMFIAQWLFGLRTLSADQLECADTYDDGLPALGDAMHIAQWLFDPDGTLGVLPVPLWESPGDDHMLPPQEC